VAIVRYVLCFPTSRTFMFGVAPQRQLSERYRLRYIPYVFIFIYCVALKLVNNCLLVTSVSALRVFLPNDIMVLNT